MTRTNLKDIISKFSDNVTNLTTLDSTLAAVIPFSKKKGVTPTQLMEKLSKLYFDNWHKQLCKELSESSEMKTLDGSYYARLADMAATEMNSIMTGTFEWEKDDINELRFDIRLYLSNLTKSIDSYTGLYNKFITEKLIEELEKSIAIDAGKREKLNELKESVKLSTDVLNIVKVVFSTQEQLNKILESCSKYIIKPDLLMDDLALRVQFDELVCKQAKEILEPLLFTLTRHFAQTVLELRDEQAQVVRAQEIEDLISTTDSTVSLIQDYETLYFDIMHKEEPYIRDIDITKVPSAIIEEVLLCGMVTEELKEFLATPRQELELITGEF